MRALTLTLSLALHSSVTFAQAPTLIAIPTRFDAGRFIATPVTMQGDTLKLLLDTGGGVEFTSKRILERAGFQLKFMMVAEGDSIFGGGKFPAFKPGLGVPVPIGSRDSAMYAANSVGNAEAFGEIEGMLGNGWFAGRVWVIDYPRHTVAYYSAPPAPQAFGLHTIPMTTKGLPRQNHPRIRVLIGGDTVDVLLDTGATSGFSPDALKILGAGPRVRGSAFASTRQFDKWRAANSTWRVIAGGEATGADLIEVPSISIAGYDTGPVWFAKRPNGAYDNMMKAVMDKPIEASIGGPAFLDFRITLDYVNQRATFERR